MKCVNHIEKDASGACNHCGKSICPDCMVEIKGEMYCKDCLALKAGQLVKEERSPAIAATLSFIIPGMGQIYNGQVGKGLLIFFTAWLVVPWVIGIFDAYGTAEKIREGKLAVNCKPGCLIAFAIGLTVSIIVFFIIGLLAAIAIPNLLRARLAANMSSAQATVRTISTAIETYKADSNGLYPADENQLMQANPPYIADYYNNKVIRGYAYTINFKPDGYQIAAKPENCGTTGTKIFTLENNGEMLEAQCDTPQSP
ncbi:MAG: hypothetical protein Q8O22_08100 [Candidatus Omnitrophota bacterium]|nr:hypothetical protein [Candidatus Omnitrophota bacterium]